MNYKPSNEQSEQYIIGALLRDNDSIDVISELLSPSDFYCKLYSDIYKIFIELSSSNKDIDIFIVHDELSKINGRGNLMPNLTDLILNTPSSSNILSHSKRVVDKSREREMIVAHESSLLLLRGSEGTVSERLHQSIANINAIDPDLNYKKTHSKSMEEIGINWLSDYENKLANPKDTKGIDLGIRGLDEIIGDRKIQPGDVVVIAARPKMFKTTVMTKIANHIGIELSKPVLTFSMEMRSNLMFERTLTQETGISNDNFYRQMTEANFGKVSNAISNLIKTDMYIDDRSNLTLSQVRSEARAMSKLHGGYASIGGLFIDYFSLMELGYSDRNPSSGYAKISIGLVSLAKELGCPLFLLAQLNRDCEKRPDKRPVPSDLGETGQLERDASLIIMLYNDEVYNADSPTKGLLELIIRVNRNGKIGTAYQTTVDGKLGDIGAVELGVMLADAEYKEKQNNQNRKWGK